MSVKKRIMTLAHAHSEDYHLFFIVRNECAHCVRAIRDLPEEGCFLSGEVPGLLQAVHNLGSQDDLRALSAPANTNIVKCVAREKLEADHAEFYQSLVAKEEKLGYKRK